MIGTENAFKGQNVPSLDPKKSLGTVRDAPKVKEPDNGENKSLGNLFEGEVTIIKPTLKDISEEIKEKYPDLSVEYNEENEEIRIKEA